MNRYQTKSLTHPNYFPRAVDFLLRYAFLFLINCYFNNSKSEFEKRSPLENFSVWVENRKEIQNIIDHDNLKLI